MKVRQKATTRLCAALASGEEFSESLGEALQQLHFEIPSSAWKNLNILHSHTNFENLYPGFFSSFLETLSLSFDPDKGLNNFERFSNEIYDKNYLYNLLTAQENLLSNLISLFSGSQHLTDLLMKEPETFNWLQLPNTLNQSKLKDQLYRESWELIYKCTTEEEMYSAIRKFKKKEYLRIGLRDLTRLAPLKIITGEISDLADVLLQQCYEFFMAELSEKHGRPHYLDSDEKELPCEFVIIGMGKLGGGELNYSSDIDILFVYSSDKGNTKHEKPTQRSISNHEFFTKLGRKITSAMNKLTADGSVFRVDLGLRPEGSSGDIVSSLPSYEIYYESWGRTWERMALLKARPCAGSMALGKEFLRRIKPFVYRKYLDFRALDEVKEMKEKINKEALHSKAVGIKNVKLGAGGIREIEFTAQVFNLIYGGKDERIRVNNLLDSLDKLARYKYIVAEDRESLRKAYIFLRELEHRIQISYGLQTQEFSQDRKELEKLALKMGFAGKTRDALCGLLEENFSHHTGEVLKIYNRLFYQGELEEGKKQVAAPVPPWENREISEINEGILEPFPFRDPKKILKNLLLLRDGPPFFHPSEKSVFHFSSLVPRILEKASKQPDPDQAIHNLEKFVSRCNGRDSLYEMLSRSGEALSLLLTLFGSSDLLSHTLINQPYLLDCIFDPEWLHKFKPREVLASEIADTLSGMSEPDKISDKLKIFKKGEEFRIGLRYLIKDISYEDMMGDLSSLAELYLDRVLKISLDILSSGRSDPSNCGFIIIGMGKLGGREIDYGSDLDVIFLFDEDKTLPQDVLGPLSRNEYFASIGEHIYKFTSQPTKAGVAYAIDTDLRPEGKKGALTTSIQGFGDYLKKRAVIWERQSLAKARYIAGDKGASENFFRLADSFVYGDTVSLSSIAEIRRLRKRVEDEVPRKGKGGVNIKLGPGGLMDIEFIAQLFQLQYGQMAERLRVTSTLEALSQIKHLGLMDPDDGDFLSDSYLFLRKTLNAMRMCLEGPADALPENPDLKRKLALCLGKQPHKLFFTECRERMERIREIYTRVFTVKTGEAGER